MRMRMRMATASANMAITAAGSWESDSLRIAAFHISQTARTWNDINYVAINYRPDDRGQKRLQQHFRLAFGGESGAPHGSPSPYLFAIDQPQPPEQLAAVQPIAMGRAQHRNSHRQPPLTRLARIGTYSKKPEKTALRFCPALFLLHCNLSMCALVHIWA